MFRVFSCLTSRQTFASKSLADFLTALGQRLPIGQQAIQLGERERESNNNIMREGPSVKAKHKGWGEREGEQNTAQKSAPGGKPSLSTSSASMIPSTIPSFYTRSISTEYLREAAQHEPHQLPDVGEGRVAGGVADVLAADVQHRAQRHSA